MDDAISITAKLDDNQEYSLAPFIAYFVDQGFHISAYQFKKEDLPQSLQAKLTVDGNFFYTTDIGAMLEESFYINDNGYDFNQYNYDNIYLPNKQQIEPLVYITEGNKDAYAEIEITYPNNEGLYLGFRIGLLNSFLYGRLLIVTIMNRGSNRMLGYLGYNEGDDIIYLLYPMIFKNYHPHKLFFDRISGGGDDFYEFFGEDNKVRFKQKIEKGIKTDFLFNIIYYNKAWRYQDYVDVGMINQYIRPSDLEVLLYQKYADHYDCPQPVLDKAWQWYRESGYTFIEEE